jgi:hypothetical protein
MSTDVNSSDDKMNREAGLGDQSRWIALASIGTKLFLVPVITIAGFVAWAMQSGSIDVSKRAASSQPNMAQNTAPTSPPDTGATRSILETPPAQSVPVQALPVDRLKISSQSWRRAGLGSNAQVTFTLRNANDYAVRDIEISCFFSRRDGSHLTDRTRTIHETVNMKSRRTFARVHVGFVNINADKAKCAPMTANRV